MIYLMYVMYDLYFLTFHQTVDSTGDDDSLGEVKS